MHVWVNVAVLNEYTHLIVYAFMFGYFDLGVFYVVWKTNISVAMCNVLTYSDLSCEIFDLGEV